jgi:hypothetical protein
MELLHDVHIEEITARKKQSMSSVLFVVALVMAVVSGFFAFLFPPFFITCIAFGILAWYIKSHSVIEFESDFTNDSLDVDVIYNQAKRKNLVSVDMEDVIVVAPSKTDPVKPYIGKSMKTWDCTSHEDGVKYYCMIFKNKKKDREEKLLFEPSEELMDMMRRKHPREIHKEA